KRATQEARLCRRFAHKFLRTSSEGTDRRTRIPLNERRKRPNTNSRNFSYQQIDISDCFFEFHITGNFTFATLNLFLWQNILNVSL
ncbi:hypothetical protein, partial [Flavobacterium aurantiibacter]|uniref:hypothetical protein n=1 Tax=Flavobacterium aurantiibacter TaxID=2023067 RepID=UPI001A9C7BEB